MRDIQSIHLRRSQAVVFHKVKLAASRVEDACGPPVTTTFLMLDTNACTLDTNEPPYDCISRSFPLTAEVAHL